MIMRAMIITIRMMIVGPSMISNTITDKHNDDGDNESKSTSSTNKNNNRISNRNINIL